MRRRRLRAVAEHPPPPIGSAPDVHRIKIEPASAGRRDPAHRQEKVRRSGDGCRRQDAIGDQTAFAIEIGEDSLGKLRALHDAGCNRLPFGFGNEQREPTQRPGALVGLAEHAIGHAHVADVAVGGREALVDLLLAESCQRIEELQPVRTRRARRIRPVGIHQECRPSVA